MRSFRRGATCAALLLACAACSSRGASGDASRPDGATPFDAGADGSAPHDGAVPSDGGSTPSDGAPPGDGGTSPEICTGGVDEDGDGRIDCDDDDCFADATCIAAHVARVVPGVTPCGTVLVRTTAQTAADCATADRPMGATAPVVCGGEVTLETTVHFFCGTTQGAAWVMERLVLPHSMTMTGPRTYDVVDYERAAVLDWEEHASGGGASSGPLTMPLYDVFGSDAMGRTTATVVSVRGVQPGDRLTRFLGLERITTHLDLDMPMSTETRDPELVGATVFTVPP